MGKHKKMDCHCCKGTGEEIDHVAVGDMLRKRRIAAKKSQTYVANKLGLSSAYLCDLEFGRRLWRDDLIQKYEKALA